ncbi:MAG: hypothetical protein JNL39_07750 [Opitutaceae bacterium]|nr:hypothetical protein [Opitutaceae bacterium]
MINSAPAFSSFRRVRAAAVLALLGGFGSLGMASAVAAPAAAVVAVQPARVADLVLLDRGFDAGLRQGMVCRVSRGSEEVAEILMVEVRPACSAALIVSLAPRRAVRAGDVASVKLIKT